MANVSQFPLKCSSHATDLATINLVFSVTGGVCCLLSTLIVVVLLLSRAYRTVLQRLFLYLMLAIVLRELFMAASLEHHWHYYPEKLQDEVCKWIGFIWNWTGILVFVFTVAIKIYLLAYVKRVSRGEELPRYLQSRHTRVVLEVSYLVISVIVTLAYAATPLITSSYGIAGAWCWIRALHNNGTNGNITHCAVNKPGMLWQIFNGYIFYVSGSVIGLILVIAVAILYCRLPSVAHNESRVLLKKTFCVIITFVVNIIIIMFALVTRLTAALKEEYEYEPAWITFAVTFPISFLLFPTTYLSCFSNKMPKRVVSCLCKCFLRRPQIPSLSTQAVTVQASRDVLSYPSETNSYSASFTNEFTEIEPLIAQTEEGYGSHLNQSTKSYFIS